MNIKTPIIQVAGAHDGDEAALICRAGANMIGFPQRLDFHRPDCSESAVAEIVSGLPAQVVPVVICYCSTARETDELMRITNTNAVQLHGDIALDEIARLRELRPDAYLIKSLVIGMHRSDAELEQMISAAGDYVDCFITDTFDPATGASGATGKTHDWSISASLVGHSPRPVILAGGLNADNVAQAIRAVRPAGVDVHTGVEGADGRKDPEMLRRFVENAVEAFAASG